MRMIFINSTPERERVREGEGERGGSTACNNFSSELDSLFSIYLVQCLLSKVVLRTSV